MRIAAWRLNGLMLMGVLMTFTGFQNVSRADEPANTRHGLFNLLDSRSKYGSNWFPEPLNTDEMDLDQEFRLNYAHFKGAGTRSNEGSVEVEKSFGLLTLEVEAAYESESEREDGVTDHNDGMGNVELSARHPVYQYVSPNGFFDYTLGARVEFAIATGSDVSKNTELVVGAYQTIGLGDHFNIQMSAGYSTLFGPGPDADERVLEYAGVFGYNIDIEKAFAVTRVTPIFEVDGETALNKGVSGETLIDGVVGANITFESNKLGQPKLLVGYVFPINDTARDDFHWGVTVSVLLEY